MKIIVHISGGTKMGLDIIRMAPAGDFRAGSYSGFMSWRETLAELVDINLGCMKGFTIDGIPWTGEEPFYQLLSHSDCDGSLSAYECEELVRDFETWDQQAERDYGKDSYFKKLYDTWWEFCCDVVTDGGTLEFA